ncbi:Golgi-associated plant pathogenesis-related protein 1 isoform X2 [Drosophila innubila]|uniref:Golgi-associated plant pathogenesis-related protein 1 isoform X2 n=1 Tax=Drosophila innubila TaxID=198719 RepID=UPI00148C4E34|nr:Golgi-associated plant pathogenesis-related protein 1 isoform X2 [Drosophila innubila]
MSVKTLTKTMTVNVFYVILICLLCSYIGISSAASFEQEVLDAHNFYRARHNAPPLELNDDLSDLATDWAKYLLATKRMEHRENSGYGENIYMAVGGDLDGSDAVKSWYDEIEDYNWRRPSFQMNTGHFTQVVWKGSKELGVGFAKCGNTIYVVCNYDPPGNYINMFQKNVSPAN